MSKRKKRSVPVAPPKQEKKMVIDMNRMNLKKEHAVPSFRTGAHQTIKDRPRKKDWKREYKRGEGPGRCNSDTSSGSFTIIVGICQKGIDMSRPKRCRRMCGCDGSFQSDSDEYL